MACTTRSRAASEGSSSSSGLRGSNSAGTSAASSSAQSRTKAANRPHSVVAMVGAISLKSRNPLLAVPRAMVSGSRPIASATRTATSRLRWVNAASRTRRSTELAWFSPSRRRCSMISTRSARTMRFGVREGELRLGLDASVGVDAVPAGEGGGEVVLEPRAAVLDQLLEQGPLLAGQSVRSTEPDLGVVVELGEDGLPEPGERGFEVVGRRDRSTPDVGDGDVADLLGGGEDVERRGDALGDAGHRVGVSPQGGQVGRAS